jgi:hypothetical protein
MLSEYQLVDLSGGHETFHHQMPFVAGKSSSLSFDVVGREALDLGKGILINHLMTGLGNSFSSGGSVNLCLSPWHSLVPFRFLRRVDVGIPYQ